MKYKKVKYYFLIAFLLLILLGPSAKVYICGWEPLPVVLESSAMGTMSSIKWELEVFIEEHDGTYLSEPYVAEEISGITNRIDKRYSYSVEFSGERLNASKNFTVYATPKKRYERRYRRFALTDWGYYTYDPKVKAYVRGLTPLYPSEGHE